MCILGSFQDADFAGYLADSKATSGGMLCMFGDLTVVPISWARRKHTAVSHSSTEAEMISLDTGQRMKDLPVVVL